ncbi:MAG TPA: hypothetical protein VE173_09065, partial [Longimicrobiales bacterium]|nr:hypothetical protein [Longimicrobiales bacterium]
MVRSAGGRGEPVAGHPMRVESILLAHPDAAVRGRLARTLAGPGRMIHQARDAGAALAVAGQARPHVLLTALHLPGGVDGFALLQALRRGGMDLEAIVWAPAPGLEALSAARRLGVLELIGGSLDAEAVERSVSNAFRVRELRLGESR